MNAVSPICLTDLAPALRWSDPAAVGPVLRHARLLDGWWRSLPLPRVLDLAGPTWLANALARLAAEQWGHLELGEFLPALRAVRVDLDDIAEPVRGAVLATAGDWDRLLSASCDAIAAWRLPPGCGVLEIASTVAWRAVHPFTGDTGRAPAPSPVLVVEAVRTIANWMPAAAPEHVHNALAYLTSATGADTAADGAPPPVLDDPALEAPQSPATRAIRTLRALRAQREEEQQAAAEAPAAPVPGDPEGPARRFRSSLLGPGRTLRRPAFGPPKGVRDDPAGAAPEPPELGRHPLVDLLEELFRGWADLERMVAAERLFAADPISIRLLADQLNVDLAAIRNAQRTVEERLLGWLASPEGEGITQHLADLSEQLGSVTTIDHLISAHPDHPVDVPSLGTPLWRVVITLFTDRRMHNGWLVSDDPQRLRWQTREMLGDAPSLTDAGLRLARIGIRQQSLRAWLLSTPGVSIRDGHVLVDPAVPMEAPAPAAGFGGHSGVAPEVAGSTTTNGLPIRRRPGAAAAPRPDPAPRVASAARCFRAPDGRWWHRVDVTGDHLNGAPVTVPPGYATHLGLQPGRLLCLTAPGADLLVLVWRDEAAFDSLRPLLRRLSAQPGDRVFITVNGDRLDARRLPAADLSDHGPTSRALHLIGYTAPAPTEEALKIIARRISEDGEDSTADPRTLLDRLNRRGDTDIAAELRPVLMTAH
ncbi:hypothetical protein [Nocardiopsis trehalosi]|jgi:hypothetical protein|uniref:hypothetical protein n=1 Tax=Nocardiopsis trehalosi TaxID=109329 RepID=UPI0008336BCE|nr:hypothetical protein [Nocardiopsis trehalosi]